MSFDKPTRNVLAKMVSDCRRSLTGDIRDQLQGLYGLQPDGSALSVESLRHLDERGRQIATELREWQEHMAATEAGPEEKKKASAFDRLAHETAFTLLNRLSALRMCEERGHVIECVRRGMESDGFVMYERFSGGALGTRGDTYRLFLEQMFGELAVDLGVLFDLRAPQSLIFPRERSLEEVLGFLNRETLAHLWKEDETIGWIYQYFNSKEEREAMREASAAPRNSRELAVRNQFFTPRYVVEFLTDNTLGRLWYEMRKGKTKLVERCVYLVRRSKEVFLTEGEESPATNKDEVSQEELLGRPDYRRFRREKDPREIKIFDPACGSGHFLLYAFDLLEVIYVEAWMDGQKISSQITGRTLRDDFPDLESLEKSLPDLILRYNLYGTDIDPRACQITALALWLRAQQTFQRQGLKTIDRPKIKKSNIVCSEPMPGEREMLSEFLADLQPKVLGQLVRLIFDKMTLAGEAGVLLKIDEDIRNAVAEAKRQWLAAPKQEQMALWPDSRRRTIEQMTLFDVSEITDEQFWADAENRVLEALRTYAERAVNGRGFTRKLFADDAERGFAFIDVCGKRYDVILMNPPFGSPPESFENQKELYPHSGRDIYAMFVERMGVMKEAGGLIGAILPRTGLFIGTLVELRRNCYLDQIPLRLLADLGKDVLDNATIRTACYVLGGLSSQELVCWRIGNIEEREEKLREVINCLFAGHANQDTFIRTLNDFVLLPACAIAYWIPPTLARELRALPRLETLADIRQGIATGDNFRFLRLFHELPPSGHKYLYYSKGGEPVPFLSDEALYVNGANACAEMKANAAQKYGSASRTIKNEETFGVSGITYSQANDACLRFRVHPPNGIYDMKGPVLFPRHGVDSKALLGFLNSSAVEDFMRMMTDGRQWHVSALKKVPVPRFKGQELKCLADLTERAVASRLLLYSADETGHFFSFGPHLEPISNEAAGQGEVQEAIDDTVWQCFGATAADIASFQRQKALFRERSVPGSVESMPPRPAQIEFLALGFIFGRWDIRFATGDEPVKNTADASVALPTCPVCMLQDSPGVPARRNPLHYPIEISWSGIVVDDPEHPDDIEKRVREVIVAIWGNRAEIIEQQVCETSGVLSLREYFRKPNLFFAGHLERYTKARRQAPIFWPLSTASSSYTVWLYYSHLTEDTLYTAVNRFVSPKIEEVDRKLQQIESNMVNASGRAGTKLREDLDTTGAFLRELVDLRDELLRVAGLPYKPNLEDGVLITASPLWRVFRFPKWRKDLEACWQHLEAGEYDWAHLANPIWPDRVQAACKKDLSIAIAHGLEELCQVVPKPSRPSRAVKQKAEYLALESEE